MGHKNFQLLKVLGSALRLKAEADLSSRGQKDFICREEKGCMGECSGNWKLVIPWVGLEIGFL
jgi:hypothetical protein